MARDGLVLSPSGRQAANRVPVGGLSPETTLYLFQFEYLNDDQGDFGYKSLGFWGGVKKFLSKSLGINALRNAIGSSHALSIGQYRSLFLTLLKSDGIKDVKTNTESYTADVVGDIPGWLYAGARYAPFYQWKRGRRTTG
ncbi:hypothetical protein [Dickeya dadantii]|uniref:hypothetical protein n=1 Tax=Dickeya dadantii TaxID=204038 RepID=UPI001FD5B938|nr:hypothetical protein [Dickeya dadantii]